MKNSEFLIALYSRPGNRQKQLAIDIERIAVCHTRDIVAHGACYAIALGYITVFIGHTVDVAAVIFKQLCYHSAHLFLLTERIICAIDALEHKFCGSCNRIRLTAAGFLKTCLSFDAGLDVKKILRAGVDVSATVLKVGHHGSATSSSEEFLRAVKPKCSVICVGYGNNFGHPRAEVLERLKNLPTKIYRTDRDGLIKFKTDGKTLRVETFNKNP